jgi:membrane peptidoglycan carboxypeptidase
LANGPAQDQLRYGWQLTMQRSLLQVQIPWRRAGAKYLTVIRLAVMSVVAALLLAATAVPVIGVVGVAARDVANTFNTLPVGKLGSAPARSTIYAANGHVITYLYPNHIYRVPVPYDQIAPVMRDAIVAIEDSSFFQQGALDPRGTLRALLHNTGGSGLQGASTLAQQYVKNVRVLQATDGAEVHAATYPNLQRKIQQLRLAAAIEHEMSPDDLLAAYLNVTPFDNNAFGIQVAAEVYFSKSAAQLTLPEAALLAGLVQAPTTYDPVTDPANALVRRSEVLTRMWQLHYVSKTVALAAEKSPLGLNMSPAPLNTGCASPQAATEAFFCSYVQYVLEVNYPSIWKEINVTGGLAVYTTLDMQDQRAANNAVDFVEAPHNSALNPNHNADTEVLLQPGTGFVKAIAVNRTYGNGPGEDSYDYAVNSQYGGDINGVQTGSSSKIFTLITALKMGLPFGHTIKVKAPATVGPFPTCNGQTAKAALYNNAEGPSKGTEVWQLAEATVQSINLYFVNLELQVGLCNVVKTAVEMGMTRADGTSLMKFDRALGGNGYPAYDYSSFTLGSVGVSPMSMAAAYASVAARGWYCSPQAITEIKVIGTHQQLPLQKPDCYRDMSKGVADAANYILQRVLFSPGTAEGRAIPGHTAAAKTGTANAGYYAAFSGYTPTLDGYVSVFNPVNPIKYPMVFQDACYQDLPGFGGFQCPSQMFGDNAPGATWEDTFLHAQLGGDPQFVYPPGNYFLLGDGFAAPTTVGGKKKPKKPGPGGGPGPGPGPRPTPLPPAH